MTVAVFSRHPIRVNTVKDPLSQQRSDHRAGGEQGRATASRLGHLALLLGERLQAKLIYPLLKASHSDERMPITSDVHEHDRAVFAK
jgi:hypothetical protein